MPFVTFSPLFRVVSFRCLGVLGFAFATVSSVSAQVQVENVPLMQGAGVVVSSQDALVEMARMPEDVRQKFLVEPEALRQWVEHLFLRRALAAQAQHHGIAQKKQIQQQVEIAKERILAEAQLEQVETDVLPKSAAIDKQIQTIYRAEPQRFMLPEEAHVRHILIAGQDEAARSKAEKILADLRAGADFEQLAREHSQDTGTAPKGGDLGFFSKGKMVPAFEQAAFGLKKTGELSPVVQTPFGFHIIRLEGRKPATVKPFDEVKDQLRAETIAKLKNDARKKEVERVRALAQGDAAALEAFIAQQKALLEQTPDKP